MSATKLYKQRCIDIVMNTTTGSVNFPEQMDLQNAFITALEVYTFNTIAVSPQLFQTVMSVADMQKCFVNLWREDRQVSYRIPLLTFNRMQNASTDPFARDQFQLDFCQISWTKCTIDIAGTLSSSTTVIPFSVYYLKEYDVKDLMATDVMFEKVRKDIQQ